MDQRLKYEQTISSKLQALPLPDMADAIWSRIETQLDIDMPTDDGFSGNNGPQSPLPKIIIGSSAFVIIIAFISIFLLPKNKNQNPQLIPITTSPEISTEQIIKPPGEQQKNIESPLNQPKQQDNSLPVVFNNTVDSSFVNQSISSIDSNKVLPNTIVQNPLPDLPKSADSVQGKKKRGVPGITDNDYRIVPKKDSSK
ncbi:MAG: hypothetical protein ACXWV9_03945 [Flavisolibacter sp.]